jgi:hypothetical protein
MLKQVVSKALTRPAPTVPPQQVGRDPAFIQKHEPRGVNGGRDAPPLGAGRGDVRPILFGRAYRFF